jgi:hypothetical protein
VGNAASGVLNVDPDLTTVTDARLHIESLLTFWPAHGEIQVSADDVEWGTPMDAWWLRRFVLTTRQA